jgi:non-ribosomal peptide synthetase component F
LTFREFLSAVNRRTLEAFENQDYQFEDLVDNILVTRDTSRNPIFDVLFTNVNRLSSGADKESTLKVNRYHSEDTKVKFDLVMGVMDTGGSLTFSLAYRTALFKKESIQRFLGYFEQVLCAVLENKDVRLQDIDISHELQSADSNAYETLEQDLDF